MKRRAIFMKVAGLILTWACAALAFNTPGQAQTQAQDPLPSWNEGPAKQVILGFVQTVTTNGSPHFVEPADRIATFDQDGTLWVEHPLYTKAVFALERVHELTAKQPEWKTAQPFKAVLANDLEAMARFTEQD
jgi:hypothetical protein